MDSIVRFSENPRIVVSGAVSSTYAIASGLARNGMNLVGIAGLEETASGNVSGYTDLKLLANQLGVEYVSFSNINEPSNIANIARLNPEIHFIVGLSQLAKDEILSLAKLNIGFHPTKLPIGRGRAPMAWIVNDCANGASTFFEISSKADSGAIISQKSFDILPTDVIRDAGIKLHEKIALCIDEISQSIKDNSYLKLIEQNEECATYNGIRRPNDGYIDWSLPRNEIYARIRSTSKPYPGAFTILPDGEKLIIWNADCTDPILKKMRGEAGRVLSTENGAVVATGDFSIKLTDFETVSQKKLKIGDKLGMSLYVEITKLKAKISELEEQISILINNNKKI